MPSATRNTNANSGNDWSAPANPNTWVNTNPQTPRVAANESTTVTISSSGASSGAQQHGEHHEDHDQHDRDDQVPVVHRRVVHVEGGRGLPADQGVGAGDGVHRGAEPGDGLQRLRRVVGVGERGGDDDPAVDRLHLQLRRRAARREASAAGAAGRAASAAILA